MSSSQGTMKREGHAMASGKRKRKDAAAAKKAEAPKRMVAKDGDRRRRMGPLVREALDRKRQVREWNIDEGPPMPAPESD